jgi:rhodanese-related sulfurtransferase
MKKFSVLMIVFMLLSVFLASCGQKATEEPTQVPPTEAPPTEVPPTEMPPTAVPEPTEVPPTQVPEVNDDVDPYAALDAAYADFLANMVAYNTIGLEALNAALVENPPFLLDVRKVSEVESNGYIPGSVLIPLNELGDNLAYLPDQDTDIVSYCGSGWRCTIALTGLGALGWNVKGLKQDSFAGWVAAGYAVDEGVPAAPESMNSVMLDENVSGYIKDMFANVPDGFGVLTDENLNTALAENPDLVLIDVRKDSELDEKGFIASDKWIHIPLEQFIEMKSMWPQDKDTPIAVYCGSGHRSTIAMTILWSYGYSDVTSLKGGFGGWVTAGYPYEMGIYQKLDAAYADFLANMVAYNTVSLEAFNAMLVDNPPYILDVRNVDEVENSGHIPGAVVLPLRELGENFAYLPEQDQQIVSYCGSGWRCTIAMTGLEALGWDVLSLKGNSFAGWVEAGYATEEGMPDPYEVTNSVELDPQVATTISDMFANIPDGWGVITDEQLNATLADNPDVYLIDVRTQAEVDEKGIIESGNWVGVPLEEFIAQRAAWPTDKTSEIVVYCGSGHRSTMAMSILWSYGYTNVLSLKGGFGGWVDAGYPVVDYVAP